MTPLVLRPALFAALVLILPASGQDDTRPFVRKKESALPAGAKVRLGIGLPIWFLPGAAFLPPDYRSMLLLDHEEGIRRIDITDARAMHPPPSLSGAQLIVSADGKRFAGLSTGTVAVREVDTGKTIARIDLQEGVTTVPFTSMPTMSLSADGKRLAQAGRTRTTGKGHVVVHDVDKKEIVFESPLQHDGPAVAALSADGKLLAMGGLREGLAVRGDDKDDWARSVQVWDIDGRKQLFAAGTSSPLATVQAAAFSHDGQLLALSSGEGPIDVWDVAKGKHKRTVLGRTRQGLHVAISPGGRTLAAVAGDGTVQRWNLADGKLIDTTEWPGKIPQGIVMRIGFVADDRVVVCGTAGHGPLVWEAPSGQLLNQVAMHGGEIRSIAFAAGGKEIVTAGAEGQIVRWDAATGRPVGEYELRRHRGLATLGPPGRVVALAPDGTRAMTEGSPGGLFDLATGIEILAMPGAVNPGSETMTLPSPDLRSMFCLSMKFDRTKPGSCVVWDLVDQKQRGRVELPPSNGGVGAAGLSPSGERLVVAVHVPGNKKNPMPATVITGWDLKTGKKLDTARDVTMSGRLHVTVASETSAIVAAEAGKPRLVDFEIGKLGDEIEMPQDVAYAHSPIVLSPTGKRFAVGVFLEKQKKYGVQIHDWPSARVIHTFWGHAGAVSALRFSEDGKLLASGSFDGTVLVWDMAAAKMRD